MTVNECSRLAMFYFSTYPFEPFPPFHVFHDSFVLLLAVWDVSEGLGVVVGVKFYPTKPNQIRLLLAGRIHGSGKSREQQEERQEDSKSRI